MANQPTAETTGVNNNSLGAARRAKNDEFYTRLTDIEKELQHYKLHFKGQVVFCNCDDPTWSSFWTYFTKNFTHLGLARVVSTHYAQGEPSYKREYTGGADLNGVKTPLAGDGDFRSPECVELLRQADIVVTNPPFSLFREYVAQLIEHGKQFLIIGNNNAITYKEIFKFIKNNQLWLGHPFANGNAFFAIPKDQAPNYAAGVYNPETGLVKFRNIAWFTNIPHEKRNQDLILFRTYVGNEGKYSKYDNYDAIEVSRVADIPADFEGCMGVPITFFDKFNPAQFEVIGIDRYIEGNKTPNKRFTINGKESYARIVIKKNTDKRGSL